MDGKLTVRRIVVWSVLLLLLLAAFHLALRAAYLSYGLRLGAVSYKTTPFYCYLRVHLKGWLVLAAALAGWYLVRLRRTRIATTLTERQAQMFFFFWALAFAVVVAMLDGGPDELLEPLKRSELEYVGAVPLVDAVGGPAAFLDRYGSLTGKLPMHAKVHPPGAVLLCWAIDKLVPGSLWAQAAVIILLGSATVVPVYRWTASMADPGVARRAAALLASSPAFVLFTATSMDALFAFVLVTCMWLYWLSLQRLSWRHAAAAGFAGFCAAMLTWSVALAALFCLLTTAYFCRDGQGMWRKTVALAAVAMGVAAGCFALLWHLTGYAPIAVFAACLSSHGSIMSGGGYETAAHYVLLALANLLVFLAACGLPCASIWQKALGSAAVSRHGAVFLRFVRAGAATVLLATLLPIYTLEVERIWLFLMPLVIVPAAALLFEAERGRARADLTVATDSLLLIQTLLIEVLCETYW